MSAKDNYPPICYCVDCPNYGKNQCPKKQAQSNVVTLVRAQGDKDKQVATLTEANAKLTAEVERAGYVKCYDTHNSELCSAISTICELNVTQRPITDEECKSIKQTLEVMRDILFSLKE
jgi:hypothetical protein